MRNKYEKKSIEEILEMMEDLINQASNVPFTSKKMIDPDAFQEYIDAIKVNQPKELELAKDITQQKQNIIKAAQEEANDIIKRTEEKVREMIAREEIVAKATEYAKEQLERANEEAANIIAEAQAKEKAIRAALSNSLMETLSNAQQVLDKSLNDVNSTLDAVSKISPDEGFETEEAEDMPNM